MKFIYWAPLVLADAICLVERFCTRKKMNKSLFCAFHPAGPNLFAEPRRRNIPQNTPLKREQKIQTVGCKWALVFHTLPCAARIMWNI
jgi:hypothetical protein